MILETKYDADVLEFTMTLLFLVQQFEYLGRTLFEKAKDRLAEPQLMLGWSETLSRTRHYTSLVIEVCFSHVIAWRGAAARRKKAKSFCWGRSCGVLFAAVRAF